MATPTNCVLWWCLLGSLLLPVAIVHVAPLPPSPSAPVSVLLALFGVVAIAVAIGTLLHRQHALAGPIERGELDPDTPEGRSKTFQAFMLNLALSESVGIYGVVLAVLAARPSHALPFAVLAIALMYVHRPTAPDLVPPRRGPETALRPNPYF